MIVWLALEEGYDYTEVHGVYEFAELAMIATDTDTADRGERTAWRLFGDKWECKSRTIQSLSWRVEPWTVEGAK